MTIGRTIDKVLTSISEVVYACIIIAIIFIAIFVLPFLQGTVYVVSLVVLAVGIVFARSALVYEGWKRHHSRR